MFSVYLSSYRNTGGSLLELERSCEKNAYQFVYPQHFLFSQTSTRVFPNQLLDRKKHGTYFQFLKCIVLLSRQSYFGNKVKLFYSVFFRSSQCLDLHAATDLLINLHPCHFQLNLFRFGEKGGRGQKVPAVSSTVNI